MMDYYFSIIFTLPHKIFLGYADNFDTIYTSNGYFVLSPFPDDSMVKIFDSSKLRLRGGPYQSFDEASSACKATKGTLLVSFAKERIGIEFIEDNIHEDNGAAPIPNVEMSFRQHRVYDTLKQKIHDTFQREQTTSEKTLLALTLFHSSFFQFDQFSRFILLTTALEALIQRRRRPSAIIDTIKTLAERIENDFKLDEAYKRCLVQQINHLKSYSIQESGRLLVEEKLGEKLYDNQRPSDFFKSCYSLRSQIVHAKLPFPDTHAVAAQATILEEFVSDILTAEY